MGWTSGNTGTQLVGASVKRYDGTMASGSTGTYTFNNNRLSFQLVSGDDDLTDGETLTIKKLTATELILEDRGTDYNRSLR